MPPDTPADAWRCCQCDGSNSGLTEKFCPICSHIRCDRCTGHDDSHSMDPARDCSTNFLPVATSLFAGPSISPSFTSLPASSVHEHCSNHVGHIDGVNSSVISNTGNDVWGCCQCDNPNLFALCPDRCPVCEHYKCPQCVV
ncbi:hypothetical protein AOQ84DRAFT_171185 [Glonium stellatum]|uniref:RanBP2-type domain-containing protein n=1 Tax=Glonium stellatum TaxID=574774 RepID=A0A8E2F7G8_9PEZI|nr:hypothetical protein AOQ84DRAFT_171185 [Glonium stellatum]